MISDSRSLET